MTNKIGIIFDFDGTIALSEEFHLKAWRDLAVIFHLHLPEGFLEKGVGNSDDALAKELEVAWNGAVSYQEILQSKRDLYQESINSGTALVPGVLEAIGEFYRLAPLVLATSSCKSDIRPFMEKYDLYEVFSHVLTIEDVVNPKPHPEVYLKAAQLISVSPSNCWVFEDSIFGTTAARNAQMNIIALTTSFPKESLQPIKWSIPDYLELNYIKRIMGISGT